LPETHHPDADHPARTPAIRSGWEGDHSNLVNQCSGWWVAGKEWMGIAYPVANNLLRALPQRHPTPAHGSIQRRTGSDLSKKKKVVGTFWENLRYNHFWERSQKDFPERCYATYSRRHCQAQQHIPFHRFAGIER
jgi:hypothetical protein